MTMTWSVASLEILLDVCIIFHVIILLLCISAAATEITISQVQEDPKQ